MGKQVRFYMLDQDEQGFLEFLCQNLSVVMLKSQSLEHTLEVVEKPLTLLEQSGKLETILLWKTVFLINQGDIQELSLKEFDETKGVYVETGKAVYSLNTANAPVVEYSRSFIRDDDRLVKGRVWAEMYRLEGEAMIYKGKDFETFYDRVVHWLRRNLKRFEGIDGYFGQRALEWYKAGGKVGK